MGIRGEIGQWGRIDKKNKKQKKFIEQEEKKEKGHEKMIVWKSIEQLDGIVREILKKIPNHKYKMIDQLESSNDSTAANFVEGYYSGSLGEYIKFLRYSRRSCAEVLVRGRRVFNYGNIDKELFARFKERCIKTGYLIDQTRKSLERKQVMER